MPCRIAVTKAGVVHERDRGMDSLRPRPDFATAAHLCRKHTVLSERKGPESKPCKPEPEQAKHFREDGKHCAMPRSVIFDARAAVCRHALRLAALASDMRLRI